MKVNYFLPLARKLNDLEKKVGSHDDSIRQLFAAMRQLMTPPVAPKPKGRIGFGATERADLSGKKK